MTEPKPVPVPVRKPVEPTRPHPRDAVGPRPADPRADRRFNRGSRHRGSGIRK